MPRQALTPLETIPEEEDEFDLSMTIILESPCCSGYQATPPPTIQVTSHASVLAPQPRYGNTIGNTHLAFPHHYSSLPSRYQYTPPYLQEAYLQVPSPASSTSSLHTAPTYPSPTVLNDNNPHQTQTLLDFVKERTQTRLEETGLADDFFTKWAIVETNMFGGVIPPESKYTVPPYALPSYSGQVRLRFIARALGFSMSATPSDLEKFLSRNLFIIMCLSFNIVPNPDLIFNDDSDNSRCGININRPGGKQFNKTLLRAMQQLEWTHPDVIEAVRLSTTDEVGALAFLCKKKVSHILPDVSQTMKDMIWKEPALEDLGSRKLQEMAVQQMRENRPYSLLRHVVGPEEVVA
ncbi:hypothetical protein TGAMA5MH_01625 [Trichoderma gamsii]|uniref:Uncharacterized protein n=1 Tax=Trichoderma gamsii TaxID=398673 RepID=A0A2K0TMC8_9HYPO|nr:hypothetical protein TGAMA5MH_01625 [Trichoderma gamsii]